MSHNKVEQDAKANLERLESILEGAGLGAWDWWLDTNKVIFDRRWCAMIGLDHTTVKHELSTWDERVHPDDKEKSYRDINAYLNGETEVYENIHRLRHENGRWVWILDRGRVAGWDENGKPLRFVGTHLDITLVKEQESISLQLQKSAKIGAWEMDVQTGKTIWTEETYRIHQIPLGTPTDKIKGISYYAPHDQETIARDVEKCIAGTSYRRIYDFVDANGVKKNVEAFGEPHFNASGAVFKLFGTIQDVTEKVQIQREKDELTRVFELAAEGANLGIWSWDLLTDKVSYSKEWARIRGLDVSQLSMTLDDWKNTTHPEDVPIALQKIDDYFKGRSTGYECEFRAKHTDGQMRHLIGRARFSNFDAKMVPTKIVGVDVDITELKLAKEQLQVEMQKNAQVAKLASLGRLSAGMAHEINNPLAVIVGVMDVLPNIYDNDEVLSKRLESMGKATQRISKIVKALKDFSRSAASSQKTPFSIGQIINDAFSQLEAKFQSSQVVLQQSIDPNIKVVCDHLEVEQAFVNLLSNALDAAAALKSGARWVKIQSEMINSDLVVRIIDSGSGVSLDIETQIFDPFFTTKDTGSGTGLGLSVTKGILDGHGAHIYLNRTIGDSCFEILFPFSIIQISPAIE